MLHELLGHAIPEIAGSDTGNAIDNENKARKQIEVDGKPLEERAEDEDHEE